MNFELLNNEEPIQKIESIQDIEQVSIDPMQDPDFLNKYEKENCDEYEAYYEED